MQRVPVVLSAALLAIACALGAACVNSVDRASEGNAATVQSQSEEDAKHRASFDDGGSLTTPVGADNFNLASDAGRR